MIRLVAEVEPQFPGLATTPRSCSYLNIYVSGIYKVVVRIIFKKEKIGREYPKEGGREVRT
jgi:hypothetical protein